MDDEQVWQAWNNFVQAYFANGGTMPGRFANLTMDQVLGQTAPGNPDAIIEIMQMIWQEGPPQSEAGVIQALDAIGGAAGMDPAQIRELGAGVLPEAGEFGMEGRPTVENALGENYGRTIEGAGEGGIPGARAMLPQPVEGMVQAGENIGQAGRDVFDQLVRFFTGGVNQAREDLGEITPAMEGAIEGGPYARGAERIEGPATPGPGGGPRNVNDLYDQLAEQVDEGGAGPGAGQGAPPLPRPRPGQPMDIPGVPSVGAEGPMGAEQNYTVQAGDTLSEIAQALLGHPQAYDLIAELNNITDPNRINVGQELRIPGSPPVPEGYPEPREPRSANTYTVQSGDNLTKIAQRAGVSVEDVIAANPRIGDPNMIYPGQVIRVP